MNLFEAIKRYEALLSLGRLRFSGVLDGKFLAAPGHRYLARLKFTLDKNQSHNGLIPTDMFTYLKDAINKNLSTIYGANSPVLVDKVFNDNCYIHVDFILIPKKRRP